MLLPSGLTVFRAKGLPTDIASTELSLRISTSAATDKRTRKTLAWAPVNPSDDNNQLATLIYGSKDIWYLCLSEEIQEIPRQTLIEEYQRETLRINAEEGRNITTKEKASIEASIRDRLLERVAPRMSSRSVYILPAYGLVLIGSLKEKEVSLCSTHLEKTFKGLQLGDPWGAVESREYCDLLTDWLNGRNLPEGFTVGRKATLSDGFDSITFKGFDLDRIDPALMNDRHVVSVDVSLDDMLNVTLIASQQITKIKPTKLMKAACLDDGGIDANPYYQELEFCNRFLFKLVSAINDGFEQLQVNKVTQLRA